MNRAEINAAAAQRAAGILQTALDGADLEYLESMYGAFAPDVDASIRRIIARLRKQGAGHRLY